MATICNTEEEYLAALAAKVAVVIRNYSDPSASPESAIAELRRQEILRRLSAIDTESIRALRAKATGKGRATDDTKLNVLNDEADTLRLELAAL